MIYGGGFVQLRDLTDSEVRLAVRLAAAQQELAWNEWILHQDPSKRGCYLSWTAALRAVRGEYRRRLAYRHGGL